jgi:hypothetical protein
MARLTISQFRKNLFQLVESAAKGEQVEFVHRGTRFRLVMPDQPPGNKLSRITPLATDLIVGTAEEFEEAHAKMTEEIGRDWEEGWQK